MFSQLGFGYLSSEILWAVGLSLCVLAVVIAFVVDYIWGELSFGLFTNAFLAFVGSVGGLILFGQYALPHVQLEPVLASLSAVAGGFALVLLVRMLRRGAP